MFFLLVLCVFCFFFARRRRHTRCALVIGVQTCALPIYAGRVAEIGPVREVIQAPKHPYTVGLMASIPALTHDVERLAQIEGSMPRLDAIPPGCAFNPRCPRVFDRCRVERPDLMSTGGASAHSAKHRVAQGCV